MLRKLAGYFQRRAKAVARFGRASEGAFAVEFAIVGPAFLATLIAIFEVTGFLFAQQILQNAAVEAGRQFMTGQAQNSNMSQSQFTNNVVCPLIRALFDCTKVMVNVQSYGSFSGVNATPPTLTFNGSGQVTNTWNFDTGTPGQVMVVQIIYLWPIVGGPLGYVLPNTKNNTTEIIGVSAFRVEPY
jgi:Flp pilus assembly protein TadG